MALKFILSASVFIFSQAPFEDRIVGENDGSGKEIIVKEKAGEINGSAANVLYTDSMIVYNDFSLKAKWDDSAYLHNIPDLFPERYIVSISIDGLLRSALAGELSTGNNGTVMIGIKKPNYRLDRYLRVRGRVDLQLGGSILGLKNKGLISVVYDLRGRDTCRGVSTSLSFEGVIYRVVIPLGSR